MEIRNYINILWRRKFAILLTLIVTLVIVVIGTKGTIPVYKSSTILRISVSAGGSVEYSDYMYADRLMNTYLNIVTSRPMLDEVMKRLALNQAPQIQAEIISNTEFIKITVEHTNRTMAATVANTLADILIAQSNKLFIGGGKSRTDVLEEQIAVSQDDLKETRLQYEILLLQTPPAPASIDASRQLLQLKQNNYASLLEEYEQAKSREALQASMITVFETARVPETPSKPQPLINVALGLVIGLIGGLGLALLLENLDTTLYSIGNIETVTKLPTLVKIPKVNKRQISAFQESFSAFAESFWSLATQLHLANHQHPKKVLLLVSAEQQQGKSTIVFHLACSLAELGNKVVAVDCDTRRPRVHSLFDLRNEIGLVDLLEQKATLDDALQKSSFEDVYVLTSGSQFAHPSQILSSVQMNQLIRGLRQRFDYVLLDSPAMLAVADVAALTPNVDRFMLVVRQGHAHKEAVQAASSFLIQQNGKSTSLIVNEVSANHSNYYGKKKKLEYLIGLSKRLTRRPEALLHLAKGTTKG